MVVNTSNEESEREAGAPDPRGPPPQLPAPVSKVRRINYTAKCVLLALEAKAQELQASVMCHGDPHNPNMNAAPTTLTTESFTRGWGGVGAPNTFTSQRGTNPSAPIVYVSASMVRH
jgi:hypothetical protein